MRPVFKQEEMFQFIHDAEKIRKAAHSGIREDVRELKHTKNKSIRKHLYNDIDRYKRLLRYTKFAGKYVPIAKRITKYGFLLQKEKFV